MSAYRSIAFLGAALVVTAALLGADPDLHRRMPMQVPSRRFLAGVAVLGVVLVAVGLVGLAVG